MPENNGVLPAPVMPNNAADTADIGAEKGTPPPGHVNIEDALHNAFMLGWQIAELKSRILIALYETNDSSLRLASIWRAIFNKIAVLQIKIFPKCATGSTLYDPPSQESLPYLYPPLPDYANVGIPEKNADGSVNLTDFKLYEVTRRAINCLTLLYVKEEDSLIPDMIKKYKNLLVNAILDAAKRPGDGGGDAVALPGLPEAPPENKLQEATEILTERTDKFLEAWDGYLRENFYTGGQIPDNDSELAAYEAGRAMSMLSWGISVATVKLQHEVKDQATDLSEKLIDAWKYTFRDAIVIRIQHQISAISSVLDDAFYEKTGIKRPDEESTLIAPNPELPSQTIRAIKLSLEYWHRTVKWISIPENRNKLRKSESSGSVDWNKAMRSALIQQANIWQTLLVGQQNLRAFNMESVTHKLMQNLTDEIQKSLQTDFKGGLNQAQQVMKEMTKEAKEALKIVGSAATTGIEALFSSFKFILWPLAGIVVICVILFVISLNSSALRSMLLQGASGSTGLLGAIYAYFGYSNIKKKKDSEKEKIQTNQDTANSKVEEQSNKGAVAAASSNHNDSNFLTRIEGAAQETGKVIMDAFERGYKQIRIELTGLNQSTAVSYPLVEFFIMSFTLQSDEEFLTEIIWSGKERGEEIKRVLSAAFGPLAVFITPNVGKSA